MVVLENMPELSCVHQLQQSSSQAEIGKSISEKTYMICQPILIQAFVGTSTCSLFSLGYTGV